jgi:hypothetical protein
VPFTSLTKAAFEDCCPAATQFPADAQDTESSWMPAIARAVDHAPPVLLAT